MTTLEHVTWWHSAYQEGPYSGPYDTEAEAILHARSSEHGWVASAQRAFVGADDLMNHIDIDDLIERWADDSDMAGEDGETPFDHWSGKAKVSLLDALTEAARQWQAEHGPALKAAWALQNFFERRLGETTNETD